MRERKIENELSDIYLKKIASLVKSLNIRTKFAKFYKNKLKINADKYTSSMEHAGLEHKALEVQYGAINKTLDFMIAKGKTKDAEIERLRGEKRKYYLMFKEAHAIVDPDGHLSDKQALTRIKEYLSYRELYNELVKSVDGMTKAELISLNNDRNLAIELQVKADTKASIYNSDKLLLLSIVNGNPNMTCKEAAKFYKEEIKLDRKKLAKKRDKSCK